MNLISELNLLSALVQDPRWTFSLLLFLLPPCFPFFLFLFEQYYLYYNLYSNVITQFFWLLYELYKLKVLCLKYFLKNTKLSKIMFMG